jgi:hypothetical protein
MKPKQSGLNGKRRCAARPFLQWGLLSLLMVAVGAGCRPVAKVAADINPVGTYTLVSVDGNKVPCTLQHEGASPTIKSGTFTINADGTCSSKVVFSLPSGGDTSREVKATYTRQGSNLTMQWEGAGTTTGTVEADAFTMNNEGMIFAYRK